MLARAVCSAVTSMSSNVCPSHVTGSPARSVISPDVVYAFEATSATATTITPRCTIIPPLARPISPRQPWRRVANASWRNADPAAKPARPNATSGAHPSAPTATATANARAPHHAGQNSRSRSSSWDALRHGSTGATAIRNSSAIPIGIDRRSKYGAPTTVRRLSSASMISGNTVPSSTTKAKIANTTLLARNAPSRESGESITPGERSRSPRHAIITSDTTTTSARKPSR
jgi:hypothetical protein